MRLDYDSWLQEPYVNDDQHNVFCCVHQVDYDGSKYESCPYCDEVLCWECASNGSDVHLFDGSCDICDLKKENE